MTDTQAKEALANPQEKVTELLDQLARVREEIADKSGYFNEAIVALIDARAEAVGAELYLQDETLAATIKLLVIPIGHTVMGPTAERQGYQAVWNKGRTSWDNKGLVSLIPEVQDEELRQRFSDCQKTGKPSVSIRVVKRVEKVEEVGSLF